MMNLAVGGPTTNDRVRWEDLETLKADLLNIRFQRDVGLPFSADEITRLGTEIKQLALEMVPAYRGDTEKRQAIRAHVCQDDSQIGAVDEASRVKPQGDPISDAIVLYPEMGHALHFISVDPLLPLPARIGFNFATSETFSYWLQSLWSIPRYLVEEIGFLPGAAAAQTKSANEGVILSAVLISVSALAIVDYWLADKPSSLKKIEGFLSSYLGRFLGYTLPEGAVRWYTGTVLALELNMLGYPVALARLGNLHPLLEQRRAD